MSTPRKPCPTTKKPSLYTTEKVISAYQAGKQSKSRPRRHTPTSSYIEEYHMAGNFLQEHTGWRKTLEY